MEILNTIQYNTISVKALLEIVNGNRDRITNEYRSQGYHQVGVVSEKITLNEYKGFKLGDEVTILKKPEMWTGEAGSYPYGKVQIGQTNCIKNYPYTGKVDKIATWFKSNDSGKYALTELGGVGIGVGGYGFSLTELIDRKLIKSKYVDLGDPSSLSDGDDTVLSVNDLIIGKQYKIKSLEWIKSSKLKISNDWANQAVYLEDVVNKNGLVLNKNPEYNKYGDSLFSIDISVIKEINNTIKIDPLITKAIEKLKAEKFISGYDGGPGGGTRVNINTLKDNILPVFNNDGTQGVFMHVGSCKREFSINQINELFEKGKTEQSFRASEWTTITTSLSLIKDKNKLPKESSWSTMRD